MRVPVMLLTSLVLLSVLADCSSRPVSIPNLTPTSMDTDSQCAVGVDASYDGKAVEVPSDCQLKVSLGSNPTTGYEWMLAGISDSGVVELVDTYYLPFPSELMGTGGMEVWAFQTVHAGSSLISMEYRRPWEEGVDPAHTFSLNVIVQ
jgi:inhibitor of cysteine peptidase